MGRHILSPEQQEQLAALYANEDLTPQELAEQFGVCTRTIRNIARRYGVKRKCGKRVYLLNEDAFDNTEDDPKAAYFLGLLLTDGHLYRRQASKYFYTHGLSLQQSFPRGDLIEKFREFMGTVQPIFFKPAKGNREEAYSLTLCSEKLYNVLLSYGITPRKTSNQVVDPRFYDNRDFWRGVFDGDGNIKQEGRYLHLALRNTSPDLSKRFEEMLFRLLGKGNYGTSTIVLESGKRRYDVSAGGQNGDKLATYLYEGALRYCDSKYQVYLDWKASIGTFPPRKTWKKRDNPQPPLDS